MNKRVGNAVASKVLKEVVKKSKSNKNKAWGSKKDTVIVGKIEVTVNKM